MSKTNLTIVGLHKQMSSEEVKNALSIVYQRPESDFDDLCDCLFSAKKPYVLFENEEESKVNLNIATLSRIGFKCHGGDADMGLSLARVDSGPAVEQICPACDHPSGGEDICQHCDVIISKYLQHKQFDDELEKQLYASSNSQKQMEKLQADKSARRKKIVENRKKNAKARKNKEESDVDENGDSSSNGKPVVTVKAQEQSFKTVYAAIASFCVLLVGGGYLLHKNLSPHLNNDIQLVAVAAKSEGDSVIAPSPEDIASLKLTSTPNSIFGERLAHQRDLEMLSEKMAKLLEKELVFSAAAMVTKQEDERLRLFGKQELIKLEELNENTVKEMHNVAVLAA